VWWYDETNWMISLKFLSFHSTIKHVPVAKVIDLTVSLVWDNKGFSPDYANLEKHRAYRCKLVLFKL
jgi:hypothetical protein